MLREKLEPVLGQLREGEEFRKENFGVVRSWFEGVEENLADDLNDMAFVCELPYEKRSLVTHPVMGNWFLDKMGDFSLKTSHQHNVYGVLRELVLDTRFNNQHTKFLSDNREEYNAAIDAFNALMLTNPEESMLLNDLIKGVAKEVGDAVYNEKIQSRDAYTTDLGHGLAAPASHFSFLTWPLESLVESGKSSPLDLSIMIVDGECPKAWHDRLVSVGMKEGGAFYDCESALEALADKHYDVVLTELDFGRNKMGGMDFVEEAYDIQKKKGVVPRISVFSRNDDLLEEAERKFRRDGDSKVFQQVNYNNKSGFRAISFRQSVGHTLGR